MYPLRRLILLIAIFGLTLCFQSNLLSAKQSEVNKPVLLKITISYDSVLWPSRNSRDYKIVYNRHLVLNKRQNDIGFELADSGSCSYRFYLEGFDRMRTPWQTNRFKEYTNLSAGNYIFRAEYRMNDGTAGEIKPVEFRVLPHWYTSSPAIVIYVMLLILLIWTGYDQLKYRFARIRYMLEQIINTRTEELIIEKEKTDNLLSNVLAKEHCR